jgi:ZIP family zinc transporter
MNAIYMSIICISIIFLSTTIGSAFVFFFKKNFGPKINNMVLGFAGGIMVAASIFGLILPSIEQSKQLYSSFSYLPPVIGFLLGGLLLWGIDRIVPHIHKNQESKVEEGLPTKKISNNFKFFLAVTIHNIPEGLSVGFACGLAIAAMNTGEESLLMYSALSLALGISIQNIPEGAAVSIPMLGEGVSKPKSFLFGMGSGIVEPIFAILGLFLAQLSIITPWLLSFAAGAMIYVTLDEILPEARRGGFEHFGIWAFMIGFAIMMLLEVIPF